MAEDRSISIDRVRDLLHELGDRVERGQVRNARGLMAIAEYLAPELRPLTGPQFEAMAAAVKRPSGTLAVGRVADTDPAMPSVRPPKDDDR